MTTSSDSGHKRSDFPSSKMLYCVLPDDGTDKRLLVELRKKYGILNAGSATCRGVGALADVKTKVGKLPESEQVKFVYIICTEAEAQAVFAHIFWSGKLDRPGGGVVWQQSLTSCTPFTLPADVPDEVVGV